MSIKNTESKFEAKVNNATQKAAKHMGKLSPKAGSSKGEKVASLILLFICFLPLFIPAFRWVMKELNRNQPKGIRTGRGSWTTKLKVEEEEAEGEELLKCAYEGLNARAMKKAEKAEADFDRRVAISVKKAQQGNARQ